MLRKKITAQAKRWTVSLLACMFMLSSACRSPDRSRTAAESHIATIDRMEILDIISQYSHTWDDRNANSWADLFVDSAEWKFHADGAPKRAIKTKQRLLKFAREQLRAFTEQGIQTRHHQTNSLFSRNPDGSIHAKTVFSVVWQKTGEAAPNLVHSGVYRDVFVKTPAGWKFQRREIHVDHN